MYTQEETPTIDQMVTSLRIQIKNYSGDVRTAFKAVIWLYGWDYAVTALREYEERKWIRTPDGDKITIDPEWL